MNENGCVETASIPVPYDTATALSMAERKLQPAPMTLKRKKELMDIAYAFVDQAEKMGVKKDREGCFVMNVVNSLWNNY